MVLPAFLFLDLSVLLAPYGQYSLPPFRPNAFPHRIDMRSPISLHVVHWWAWPRCDKHITCSDCENKSEQTRKKVASVFRPFFSIDRIVRVRPTVLGASASSSLKKSANSSHFFCVCRGYSTKRYVLQARRSKAPSRLGHWWLTATGSGK